MRAGAAVRTAAPISLVTLLGDDGKYIISEHVRRGPQGDAYVDSIALRGVHPQIRHALAERGAERGAYARMHADQRLMRQLWNPHRDDAAMLLPIAASLPPAPRAELLARAAPVLAPQVPALSAQEAMVLRYYLGTAERPSPDGPSVLQLRALLTDARFCSALPPALAAQLAEQCRATPALVDIGLRHGLLNRLDDAALEAHIAALLGTRLRIHGLVQNLDFVARLSPATVERLVAGIVDDLADDTGDSCAALGVPVALAHLHIFSAAQRARLVAESLARLSGRTPFGTYVFLAGLIAAWPHLSPAQRRLVTTRALAEPSAWSRRQLCLEFLDRWHQLEPADRTALAGALVGLAQRGDGLDAGAMRRVQRWAGSADIALSALVAQLAQVHSRRAAGLEPEQQRRVRALLARLRADADATPPSAGAPHAGGGPGRAHGPNDAADAHVGETDSDDGFDFDFGLGQGLTLAPAGSPAVAIDEDELEALEACAATLDPDDHATLIDALLRDGGPIANAWREVALDVLDADALQSLAARLLRPEAPLRADLLEALAHRADALPTACLEAMAEMLVQRAREDAGPALRRCVRAWFVATARRAPAARAQLGACLLAAAAADRSGLFDLAQAIAQPC